MKLADVMLVVRKELRETLRDRRTLAVMVMFPLVVYPLVSLATVQVLATRIGRTEKIPARVAISGEKRLAEKVQAHLAARNHDGKDNFVFLPAPATAADVRAGTVDAVTFTSQPAVHHLFRIAEDAGRADDLRAACNEAVLPVCVGPVCADAALAEGITRPAWPDPPSRRCTGTRRRTGWPGARPSGATSAT